MLIRKRGSKELPAISTASLPDIIFILLFFFMVATVMRDTEQKVIVHYPQATELQKLEKKSLVTNIFIGPPNPTYAAKLGDAPRLQLNDTFATKDDLKTFILNERAKLPEALQGKLTVSLKVDKDTKMGIVSEVKSELRRLNALKINYSATPKVK
ncbi:MAG: biopolymer transporter ExbD [Chitinophagales bacterium]|nr:biopolymer transporter ExbD [Bacteroidota bacterium]MCB9044196.1 biopolymer transporter ExbD [Chitinophagales bacterium]